ncbi:uncharacterized protein LOC126235490 [Schistocerca nitens]|uniref:uncharacterized protein LOC126235490 n=1 Tax=Schistocerca nitens TaxID=7011 RepID=UPI0021173547|nr:uncharacterized protein LOC126235490 [Schistocerca nitens]
MATTRGPNVSILHLRNAADPWDCPSPQQQQKQGPPPQDSAPPPPPASFARTTPRSSGSASATANSGGGGGGVSAQLKPTYSTLPRRESSLLSGVTAVSTTVTVANSSGSCSRELSPVRWCDREVDGVYLGRSGWVQVQQRSLDESRRAGYGAGLPPVPAAATTVAAVPAVATLPRRPTVRLADYHCNSEPGKCPVRPAYLPLAAGFQPPAPPSPPSPPPHRQDGAGPALPMSPPSITPIISPPPAFQDTTQRYQTAPRLRSGGGGSSKTPFLPRSNALVVENEMASPPPSPPPPQLPLPLPSGWSTLPAGVGLRARRLTPSPVGTPAGAGAAAARLPQTKSLEDTSASAAAAGPQRRSQFHQKRDSSSTSSSSSFGFRSLDSCAGALGGARAMPRLSETDSSVGGYEDGDELDDRRDSSLNLSSFSSSVTVVNSSPETPSLKERGSVGGGSGGSTGGGSALANGPPTPPPPLSETRVSPRGRSHNHRSHPLRRSPGSDGSKKQLASNDSSSSSSSSSISSSSSCQGGGGGAPKPGTVSAHVYHTWDGRNRVRRSRSLQLPETKSPSPGHAGPQPPPPPPGSQPGTVNTTPPAPTPEYQYFLVKNYRDKPSTTQYYHQATSDQHRVLVKLPQESSRRQYMQHTRKAQSEDCRYDDWEAVAEEARAVTEYLYGTRSRAAARALLAQRYHSSDQPEEPARRKDNGRPFNVFVVRKTNPHNHHDGSHLHHHQQVPAPPPQYVQRPRRSLQRGVTTPTSAADANPCNPDTCDFWPHCAHRDSLYPPTKSSTPSPSSSAGKLPPSAGGNGGLSMRASQSYPSSSASSAASRSRNGAGRRAHHDAPDEKAASAGSAPPASRRSNGSGARSSPPSLDRLEEYDALTRKIQSVLDGAAAATAALAGDAGDDLKRFGKWRASNGLDKQQHRRSALLGERPKTVDAVGPPTPPQHSPQQQQKALKALRGNGGLSLDLDALPLEHHQRGSTKTSPVSVPGASRSPSNKGGGDSSSSSASSSSSDVWVTTSDRTVTKSPRTHKSSGASTPLGSAGSGSAGSRGRFLGSGSAGSGSAEREAPVSRPGSAPTQDDDGGPQRTLDAQQRSLSLPKSFLSERYGLKPAKHR